MSVLTARDCLNQTIDKSVPSFAASRSRRASKRISVKLNPHRNDATNDAERVWGVALKKFEAENLLDWLEANGRCGKLAFAPGEGFTVW
jgi:hypothetical protein